MRAETHSFLEHVRNAEGPTQEDEERVLRALQTSVAAGVLPSVAAAIVAGPASSRWASLLRGIGAKLGVVAVCASAGLGTGDSARSSVGEVIRSAALAPHPRAQTTPATTDESSQTVTPEPSLASPAAPRVTPHRERLDSKSPRAERRAPTLRDELRLLQEVQAALKRGDGEGALRKLNSHHTADRVLLAERQAARILALCLLGKNDQARRAAAEFSASYPGSVHRQAIANSCASPPRIPGD